MSLTHNYSDSQNLIKHTELQDDSPTKKEASLIRYNLDVTPDSKWILMHTSQQAKNHLLYIQEAGEFFALPNYYTRRNSVDSYLLKITLDGEAVLEYENKQYLCHAGNFFLIDCRKPHYYATASASSGWHVIWMHFWGNSAHDFYKSFLECNHNSPVSTLQSPNKTVQLIRDFITNYLNIHNNYCTDLRVSVNATQVLSECIIATIQNTTVHPKTTIPKRICDIYNYVTEHFTEKITLDSLSSTFFINKFYLQKQFQHYYGKSPREYQNELRIDSAKEFLRMTDLTINEISFQLGFENTSYFIHLFKNKEQCTPLQYRNNWN